MWLPEFLKSKRRKLKEGFLKEFGIDYDLFEKEVLPLVEKDLVVNAINRFRKLTGEGLRFSKEVVDSVRSNPSKWGW